MTRAVIYSMSVSLDCFIADPGGDIGWIAACLGRVDTGPFG